MKPICRYRWILLVILASRLSAAESPAAVRKSASAVSRNPQMSARPDLELPKSPVSVPWFEDIGQKAGLNVPHISAPEKRYVVESISGGLGMF